MDFVAEVKYSLSIRSHGRIFLIFENENDHMIEGHPLVLRNVDSPGGEVTLKDRITIPTRSKELRLFIPLDPEGFAHTTGEVTIRYPIAGR